MYHLRALLREAADAISSPDLVDRLRDLIQELEVYAEVTLQNQAAQVQADAGLENFGRALNMMRVK